MITLLIKDCIILKICYFKLKITFLSENICSIFYRIELIQDIDLGVIPMIYN